MAAHTIRMEQYNLILKLHASGYSIKGIARQLGLSRNTVRKYLDRQAQAGETPAPTPGASLPSAGLPARVQALHDHFKYAELEIKKTGVTRHLLWLEYKDAHIDGFQYSHYCYHFQQYLRHKEVVMHLEHKPGEETMIDFAGKKMTYVDPDTGQEIGCQVFVAVMPFSGLLYAQAVHTQQTADFVCAINGMCSYYGGLSGAILCDNLKTAVVRPDRYEPVFTDVCYQLGEHYGTSFTAARPYKPRDKAMVERCVQIAYTQVYAPLRKRTFHSLKELNLAIREMVDALNLRAYKGSAYSRRDLFEAHERQALQPLPARPFVHKKVVEAAVQRHYHVWLGEDKHYYSVPFIHAGKRVKVLYDADSVEIYLGAERIACHVRRRTGSTYHTITEHMPKAHEQALGCRGWTEKELLDQALRVGKHTGEAAKRILVSNIIPAHNFKSCYGMIMLQKKFGARRLEAACERALGASRVTFTMIRSILEKGLDHLSDPTPEPVLPDHQNIRGPAYYV